MRKVNLWNRLFHSGDLLEQEKQYQCLGIIIDAYPSLKKSMEAASSLGDLLVIHRQAWGFGFQNEKLGPCSYGMFRAMNILEMIQLLMLLDSRPSSLFCATEDILISSTRLSLVSV